MILGTEVIPNPRHGARKPGEDVFHDEPAVLLSARHVARLWSRPGDGPLGDVDVILDLARKLKMPLYEAFGRTDLLAPADAEQLLTLLWQDADKATTEWTAYVDFLAEQKRRRQALIRAQLAEQRERDLQKLRRMNEAQQKEYDKKQAEAARERETEARDRGEIDFQEFQKAVKKGKDPAALAPPKPLPYDFDRDDFVPPGVLS